MNTTRRFPWNSAAIFLTVIHCNNGKILPMDILTDVKQEDPLSLLIFNLILDSIKGIFDETMSIRIEIKNVSAFADDLSFWQRKYIRR